MSQPKLKYYKVIRVVKEEYEVRAFSQKDAKYKVESPNVVTVIKETIKLCKSQSV